MVQKKTKIALSLMLVLLLAAAGLAAGFTYQTTNNYLDKNGQENVSTVVDQLQKNYDSQIEHRYNDLQLAEALLFQNGNRTLSLDEVKGFTDVLQQNTGGELVFLKSNGIATKADGGSTRMEIQSRLLLDLQAGKNIAKQISLNNEQGEYYLVAIPCEEYRINGEAYAALGSLFSSSQIDEMLNTNAYGGKALTFMVDKEGNITYTNQADESMLRNYSLLKHLRKDEAITEEQLTSLEQGFSSDSQDTELLGQTGKQYYLGYAPLESNNGTLVCIVPKSVTSSELLGYQQTIMRTTLLLGALLLLLTCALVYSMFKARNSAQKARFEEENRQLQMKSMRALESEKNKAEAANKSKSEFLANMSHDIRTPMNAIVGLTNLMEHDQNNPEKMDEHIRKIQTSSRHLLSLINDVLDMSKIESDEIELNREPVSLAEQVGQIDSIIRSQAEERNQSFVVRVHGISHENFVGDALRIRQLFINLLSNSVKYTQEGGAISLDLTELPSENSTQAMFEIKVTDNGCGMTPEFAEHIFEPFTRAENSTTNRVQGTGLGLSIVKNILDMIGGTISVETKPGQGSCFTAVLPLQIDQDSPKTANAKRVLLVTEDLDLAGNVQASFEGSEAQLLVAHSSQSAEKKLRDNPIDAVLLAGRIGTCSLGETAASLREHSGNEALLFCISYSREEEAHDLLQQGKVNGLISRPFFLANFAHAVSQINNAAAPAKPDDRPVLEGMNFLCAEDNTLNAEILKAILDMNGATCTIHPNGKALVEAFEGVVPGQFDAILMDVQMPIMNGLEATKQIRIGQNPLGQTIPIIAMTANAFSSDMQQCLDAGMDAHVAKPLDVHAFEQTVKSLVKKR